VNHPDAKRNAEDSAKMRNAGAARPLLVNAALGIYCTTSPQISGVSGTRN